VTSRLDKALGYISTVGPVGFSPIAPGTAGSAIAALGVWGLGYAKVSLAVYAIITVAVTVIGIWTSDKAEAIFGKKDPGCVVIDEVAGYMVGMALLPPNPGYLIAAFFIFRFFDIVKPPPINALQKLKGGMGIMIDDILAGVYTNIVLQIWLRTH
jgi:phosphatidylglycerophosphatase A